MTLPATGAISAADINVELGRASTAAFDINGAEERALAGVPSGAISFDDFHGKSAVDWANISATGTGTITGTNADQTMNGAGTLNFSTNFPGSYNVFKNGVAQGQVASLAVAAGNTVHFSATDTPGPGALASGTFTVSGAVSDTFTISIRDTGTP